MIGRLMTFSGVLASSRASFFCFIVHEHVINMINSPQQRSDKIYKLSETLSANFLLVVYFPPYLIISYSSNNIENSMKFVAKYSKLATMFDVLFYLRT